MTDGLHNEQGRRQALQRFGYRPSPVAGQDHAEVWRQLRVDFPGEATRLEFSALTGAVAKAAEAYCAHRGSLDGLMDRCDAIHAEIFERGPDRELVETYAAARDEYEDAVERFGELRRALQAAMTITD